ncbi:MAG TPA: hypothetical protein VFU56_02870 [Gaiellaceae bacterium]|nr:hypothetical protein [Gaiellaceae bacterium]
MTSPTENGALGSVLDLERALETAQTAASDSEARLERARREANDIVTAARERAARRTAERQSSVASAAATQAQAMNTAAEAAAATIRARAAEVEAAFVEAGLALVLPAVTQEATCSSR